MKKCQICGCEFEPSKFNKKTQKYCSNCRNHKRKEIYKNWYKKNGRKYFREYMSNYFKPLAIILVFFFCIAWTEQKTKLGIQDFDGNIGLGTSIVKPPSYQINLGKYGSQYLSINRFSFKKKPLEQDEEDLNTFTFYEPKEKLSWGVEYGATSTMTEISLIDAGSITGWRLSLGNASEILWGRNEYGDLSASFSITSEHFSFVTFKTFGKPETEEQILSETNNKNPVVPFSAKPLAKREGGAFMFPFTIRESRGIIEFGVMKRYDEILKSDTKGYALNTSLDTPLFRTSFRIIDKGFESQSRTIDYSISGKYLFESLDKLELRAGYRLMSYSDQPIKHNATLGFTKQLFGININTESRYNFFDNSIGLTYSISGKAGDLFSISSSRSENYSASSTSENTSISISRKEGSISGNYSKNVYRNNKTYNSGLNANINIFDMSLGAGVSISESFTPRSYKYILGTSYNFRYKLTSISGSFNPDYTRLSLNRDIPLSNWGKSISLGVSYNQTPKTQSITSNINYLW